MVDSRLRPAPADLPPPRVDVVVEPVDAAADVDEEEEIGGGG